MDYISLFFGPQLIGLLFIIIGLMRRYFPPKNVNRWQGYRTPLARTNQKTWNEGNRYSGIYMIKAGVVVLMTGFILNAAAMFYADANTQKIVAYFILFGGAMLIGILSTMVTEKHLAKTFKLKPPVRRK